MAKKYAGAKDVSARNLGVGKLKSLEYALGSYV
jgi:hypothetical protein